MTPFEDRFSRRGYRLGRREHRNSKERRREARATRHRSSYRSWTFRNNVRVMNHKPRPTRMYREDVYTDHRIRHFPFRDSENGRFPRYFNPENRFDPWRPNYNRPPYPGEIIPYHRIARCNGRDYGRRQHHWFEGPAPEFYQFYAEDYERHFSLHYRRPFDDNRPSLRRFRSDEHLMKPTASVYPMSPQRNEDCSQNNHTDDVRRDEQSDRQRPKSVDTKDCKKRVKQKVVFMPSAEDDLLTLSIPDSLTISEKITTQISYNRQPAYISDYTSSISPNLIVIKSTPENEDEVDFSDNNNERYTDYKYDKLKPYRQSVISENSSYLAQQTSYSGSEHDHSIQEYDTDALYSRHRYPCTPQDMKYGNSMKDVYEDYYNSPGTPSLDEHNGVENERTRSSIYYTTESESRNAFPLYLKDLGLSLQTSNSKSSLPTGSELNEKVLKTSEISGSHEALHSSPEARLTPSQTSVAIPIKKEFGTETLMSSTDTTLNSEGSSPLPGLYFYGSLSAKEVKSEQNLPTNSQCRYSNGSIPVLSPEPVRASLEPEARNSPNLSSSQLSLYSEPTEILDLSKKKINCGGVLDLSIKTVPKIKTETLTEGSCVLTPKEDVIIDGYFIKHDKNIINQVPKIQENMSTFSEKLSLSLDNVIIKEENFLQNSAIEEPKTPEIIVVSVESLCNKEGDFTFTPSDTNMQDIPREPEDVGLNLCKSNNQIYYPVLGQTCIPTSHVTNQATEERSDYAKLQERSNGEQKSANTEVNDFDNSQTLSNEIKSRDSETVSHPELSFTENHINQNTFETESVRTEIEKVLTFLDNEIHRDEIGKEYTIPETESRFTSDSYQKETESIPFISESECNFSKNESKGKSDNIESESNPSKSETETPSLLNGISQELPRIAFTRVTKDNSYCTEKGSSKLSVDLEKILQDRDLNYYKKNRKELKDEFKGDNTLKHVKRSWRQVQSSETREHKNEESFSFGESDTVYTPTKNSKVSDRGSDNINDGKVPDKTTSPKLQKTFDDIVKESFTRPAQKKGSSKSFDRLSHFTNSKLKDIKNRSSPNGHVRCETIRNNRKLQMDEEDIRKRCSDFYKYRKRSAKFFSEDFPAGHGICYQRQTNLERHNLKTTKQMYSRETSSDHTCVPSATRLANLSPKILLSHLQALSPSLISEVEASKDTEKDLSLKERLSSLRSCDSSSGSGSKQALGEETFKLTRKHDAVASKRGTNRTPKKNRDEIERGVSEERNTSQTSSRAPSKRKCSRHKKKSESASTSTRKETASGDQRKCTSVKKIREKHSDSYECPPSPDY